MSSNSPRELRLVYDGACPFCRNYVALIRLREAVGEVRLIDARAPGEDRALVDRLAREGFDLDEGMALARGDRISHGAECLIELALLSTPSGAFNRLNAWIFGDAARARRLYPLLRAARNLTIGLNGAGPIRGRRRS